MTGAGGQRLGWWSPLSRCQHQRNMCVANQWARNWLAPTPCEFFGATWYASQSDLACRNEPNTPGGAPKPQAQTLALVRMERTFSFKKIKITEIGFVIDCGVSCYQNIASLLHNKNIQENSEFLVSGFFWILRACCVSENRKHREYMISQPTAASVNNQSISIVLYSALTVCNSNIY